MILDPKSGLHFDEYENDDSYGYTHYAEICDYHSDKLKSEKGFNVCSFGSIAGNCWVRKCNSRAVAYYDFRGIKPQDLFMEGG